MLFLFFFKFSLQSLLWPDNLYKLCVVHLSPSPSTPASCQSSSCEWSVHWGSGGPSLGALGRGLRSVSRAKWAAQSRSLCPLPPAAWDQGAPLSCYPQGWLGCHITSSRMGHFSGRGLTTHYPGTSGSNSGCGAGVRPTSHQAYSLHSPHSFLPTATTWLILGLLYHLPDKEHAGSKEQVQKITPSASSPAGSWHLEATWARLPGFGLRLSHTSRSTKWMRAHEPVCHLLDAGYQAQAAASLLCTLLCTVTTVAGHSKHPLINGPPCWLVSIKAPRLQERGRHTVTTRNVRVTPWTLSGRNQGPEKWVTHLSF